MCIIVEFSTITTLDLSFIKNITSTCSAPALSINQNPDLTMVKFDTEFLATATPNSIAIRGNPRLSSKAISSYKELTKDQDIQEFGECAMPHFLWSLKQLSGCSSVYGTIYVNTTTEEVLETDASISFTGCVLIVESTLTNVDFLKHFVNFKLVERLCDHGCEQNELAMWVIAIVEAMSIDRHTPLLSSLFRGGSPHLHYPCGDRRLLSRPQQPPAVVAIAIAGEVWGFFIAYFTATLSLRSSRETAHMLSRYPTQIV
ncbi:hypothetical protein Y032_0004g1798 [Ancylostoma ceylanicum]|uniref:Receptor L-domain domain-containing protein n=1 Tax=Ancylostoma ceylanicum TaxID=53326 RepID=A0A016VTB0_9BILA|nr:hypothetical protein Y032_0004g1798 [Ancylostoma ceylanicum]